MTLLDAINAYNDGNVTLRALRAVPGFISPQAENGFYQDYVGVHAHQLAEWSAPAETMPEAIAALAVIAEDVDETLEGLPMEAAIFKAAFAYLAAFNHSGAAPVLEALFREWAAADSRPPELRGLATAHPRPRPDHGARVGHHALRRDGWRLECASR